MALKWTFLLVALLLAQPATAQRRGTAGPLGGTLGDEPERTMPDGRSRTLLLLKSDAKKSSEDMARVVKLAAELQEDVERNEFHTVDLGSVRKAEEIIKLVRRVKTRLIRAR